MTRSGPRWEIAKRMAAGPGRVDRVGEEGEGERRVEPHAGGLELGRRGAHAHQRRELVDDLRSAPEACLLPADPATDAARDQNPRDPLGGSRERVDRRHPGETVGRRQRGQQPA